MVLHCKRRLKQVHNTKMYRTVLYYKKRLKHVLNAKKLLFNKCVLNRVGTLEELGECPFVSLRHKLSATHQSPPPHVFPESVNSDTGTKLLKRISANQKHEMVRLRHLGSAQCPTMSSTSFAL